MSQLKFLVPCLVLAILAGLSGRILNADQLDGDKLLASEHIVEIKIKLPNDDWQALCSQFPNAAALGGGDPTESSYTYFQGDIWIDGEQIKNVGIRKKGFFGSNDSVRPSLKIKFDEFKKQDPVTGLDRLTLNNNKQDKSLLSQFLAYKIFRKSGVSAPRSNFAKVTVNGKYLGIYSNVESIKKPFLQRNFGSDEGALYEGALTDFYPLANKNIEAKNKAADDRDKINRLTGILNAAGDLDTDAVAEIIDLDHFMKYWATESLLGFWDGYNANQNNYYLYFSPDDGKARFIPWGADWLFTANGPFGGFGGPTSIVNAQSILANRLYHSKGIPSRYQQATDAVLKDAWHEKELLAEIDQMEKMLVPHLGEQQLDAPEAMNQLRSFISNRRKTITEKLADGPVQIPAQPRKPAYQLHVGMASGTFVTVWGKPNSEASPETEILLTINDKLVEFKEVRVTIDKPNPRQFGGFGFPASGGGFGGGRPGGQPTPSIANWQLIGTSESGSTFTISTMFSQDELKSNQELKIIGQLTELPAGQPGQRPAFGGFGPRGPNRSVVGTVKIIEASTTDGETISGSFTFKVIESRGGMLGGPPPGRAGGFGRREQGRNNGNRPPGRAGGRGGSAGRVEAGRQEGGDQDDRTIGGRAAGNQSRTFQSDDQDKQPEKVDAPNLDSVS